MTEDEINKLADLLYDKIMEKQEIADEEYAQQMARLMGQGYIIEDVTDKLGINE